MFRCSGLIAFLGLVVISTPALSDVPPDAPAQTFEPAIRAEQLRPHVQYLASPELEGRGSDASKLLARRYIVQQWKKIGLRPLFADSPAEIKEIEQTPKAIEQAKFEQAIPGANGADGSSSIMGYNVGAWLPGSDSKLAKEIVIISAHYDHLGLRNGYMYPGADDNASGVAMLIEAARQLANEKVAPRRSIVFIAFDLEERLLWGSRWFAAHPPWPIERVKLFMTADMIGRSLGDLPFSAVFVFGSERSAELRNTLKTIGAPTGLDVCRLGTDIVGTRSDYGTFRDREIPYLFFSTGEHPDYHSPNDTPERLDFEKASRIASLMLRVCRDVADLPQAPTWSGPDTQDLHEPRTLHRIASLLLEADKKKPLTSTQRFLVTNVRNRSRQIIDANTMTPDDRAWLVRMSQILLASVF
ncbi:MAG: M20/M25/M40 family metallo-hydrolase [Planctomycetaceae bacterium]